MNKFDPTSHIITEDNVNQLKNIFPEAFTEQGIDFELLKTLLGEKIETGPERYQFNWPGKTEAIRASQLTSMGTLVPDKESSVDWDTTQNLYLEGDNLEILKLLQKSYTNKVKMIYIDPPYNTGKDFVYPDKYGEGLKTYLEYTGQVDGEGKKISTNTETDGRYHSKWLNMMYPRLMLARNLLKEDGVIFVSIDDHEQANLKKILDEIFGADNFVATIIWEKKYSPQNDAKWFSDNHDFILLYAKNKQIWRPNLLSRTIKQNSRYTNRDNDPRGPWKSSDFSVKTYSREYDYPITTPSGKVINPPKSRCWRTSKINFNKLILDNRIWFGEEGNNVPSIKRFLSEVKQGIVPLTIWKYKEVGHNQDAAKEVRDLFDGYGVFDTPKPVRLLRRIAQISTKSNEEDLVLDFFSGSSTTAHAVMKLNAKDGGNRRFVMVQLQEPLSTDSEAFKAGFENIAKLGRERVRRAGTKIKTDYAEKIIAREIPLDTGFKTYRLALSTFSVWDATKEDNLQLKLEQSDSLILPNAKSEDVLTELILKSGYGLTEKIEEKDIEGKKIYLVADGKLIISLESGLTLQMIRSIANLSPSQFVARELGFSSDDLLTNTAQIMKDKGIDFRVL